MKRRVTCMAVRDSVPAGHFTRDRLYNNTHLRPAAQGPHSVRHRILAIRQQLLPQRHMLPALVLMVQETFIRTIRVRGRVVRGIVSPTT